MATVRWLGRAPAIAQKTQITLSGTPAADDIIAIDGWTDPPNVFKIASDKITDYPSYVGAPFLLGRDNTRIYILRDDAIAVTFTVDTNYQPRRLTI